MYLRGILELNGACLPCSVTLSHAVAVEICIAMWKAAHLTWTTFLTWPTMHFSSSHSWTMSFPPCGHGLIYLTAWKNVTFYMLFTYWRDGLLFNIVTHKHTLLHVFIFLACPLIMYLFWAEFSTQRVFGCLNVVTEGSSSVEFVLVCVQKEPQGSFQSLVWAEEHLWDVVCDQPQNSVKIVLYSSDVFQRGTILLFIEHTLDIIQ